MSTLMRYTQRLLSTVLLLASTSSPVLAQRAPSRAWVDIDDVLMSPVADVQAYTVSKVVFGEVATSSVTYGEVQAARVPAFGGGVQIYRGFGIGMRATAVDRQTTPAAISLSLPDPIFFNHPHTTRLDQSLDRTERTVDLAVAYVLPLPWRFSIRPFAGRSRARVTQSVVEQFTYKYPDANGGVSITNVAEQTASGYAWGSLIGLDAGFFLLRNVGVGVQVVRRNIDVPTQSEPFSDHPFALSTRRTRFAAGLRLRF